MEIGTLTARIKELEGQIEEDRGNAAREITTLVSQTFTRFNRDDLRSRWQIQLGARVRF